MSHESPGRHRAEAASRPPTRPGAQTWMVAAASLAVVAVIGGLAWWLIDRNADTSAEDSPPASSASTPSASTATSGAPTTDIVVESERVVTVAGNRITVEETSRVVDGRRAQAIPATVAPMGLELIATTITTSDGRRAAFDSPTTLDASGTLTVRGSYRLTSCPDLLPVQWPSPSEFPGATRTYPRLEEPLHTAYAICPDAPSRARPLDGLSGSVVPGDVPTVRLVWEGSAPLTVQTVGSASGVAVIAVEPGCGGGCVAQLPGGGSATVALQPVDPCPPATDNDDLVLILDNGRVASVRVQGLHSAICG